MKLPAPALALALAGACLAQAPLPPLSKVSFAWDYPTNQPLTEFALLWGTNRFEAGTNQTATVQVAPGLHDFTAVAVRNGLQSDPSNVITVRAVGFQLEHSTNLVDWRVLHSSGTLHTNPTGGDFYRVRVFAR